MTDKQKNDNAKNKGQTDMKNTVHFILQGKGGVGKSYVSAMLAQYIKNSCGELAAFDTDQINTSFAQYKMLEVKKIPLADENENINTRMFDNLIVDISETESPCVIDNGANTFSPLLSYLVENDIFQMLKDMGKRVYIHTIIAGGSEIEDTVRGFYSIIKNTNATPVILWLNEYQGTTDINDKPFTETKVFKENAETVTGLILLPPYSKNTFGHDIAKMTKDRLTVAEAIASADYNIMEKQRIKTMWRNIEEQLNEVTF